MIVDIERFLVDREQEFIWTTKQADKFSEHIKDLINLYAKIYNEILRYGKKAHQASSAGPLEKEVFVKEFSQLGASLIMCYTGIEDIAKFFNITLEKIKDIEATHKNMMSDFKKIGITYEIKDTEK